MAVNAALELVPRQATAARGQTIQTGERKLRARRAGCWWSVKGIFAVLTEAIALLGAAETPAGAPRRSTVSSCAAGAAPRYKPPGAAEEAK